MNHEVELKGRAAHKHFLSDRMKIEYYCSIRKKRFTNFIQVDLDLATQRKINGCTFRLIQTTKAKHSSFVIERIDGRLVTGSEFCSIPAYLFGPEYYFARRKDPTKLFDFRKSAFEPCAEGAERYAESL